MLLFFGLVTELKQSDVFHCTIARYQKGLLVNSKPFDLFRIIPVTIRWYSLWYLEFVIWNLSFQISFQTTMLF
ncbi:hypothetical protein SY85_15215 [Flavisolibacter tropicus]|uniref:Uncharacterized protein n=1 Tax=Flavisolibacter tropicus TaxID=1492898 RepID=A0A172TX29_9BACT|nr:hypothetical protein SY85_15215 [Flavisolibacter tropicus]